MVWLRGCVSSHPQRQFQNRISGAAELKGDLVYELALSSICAVAPTYSKDAEMPVELEVSLWRESNFVSP
jgi:hypothetical protein